jgi:hypothetical protein
VLLFVFYRMSFNAGDVNRQEDRHERVLRDLSVGTALIALIGSARSRNR